MLHRRYHSIVGCQTKAISLRCFFLLKPNERLFDTLRYAPRNEVGLLVFDRQFDLSNLASTRLSPLRISRRGADQVFIFFGDQSGMFQEIGFQCVGALHLRQRIRIFLRVALNNISQTGQGFLIQLLRFTDQRARSGTPFRLFGTASVGSQSLTGISRLNNLRFDLRFATRSTIWPFETGWATEAKWLLDHVSILHAEIYPSVREPSADLIKDRGQVRSMWEWARNLDRQELLWF